MGWNEQKRAAVTKLTLRLAVAVYLLYLAWKILGGTMDGASPITPWLSYTICAVFLLSAVGIGLYSLRQFRQANDTTAQSSENDDMPKISEPGPGHDGGDENKG